MRRRSHDARHVGDRAQRRARLPAGLARLWLRVEELENIADRLAATCADPVAVADYLAWKENREGIR